MNIKVKAIVVQVSFDREYNGIVEITIPDHKITRTFNFTLLDPAGDNTKYEILHNNEPFLTVQAGGSEGEMRRQIEALPKGRQLLLTLFFEPVSQGYMTARINHVDPESRARQHNMAAVMANFGGSISYRAEVKREYTPRVPAEFSEICAELNRLPATLPQYVTAAQI